MKEMNINKAMSNPATVFGEPGNVLKSDTLTKSQKREVLLHWQAEAIHLQESDAEGFNGGERSRLDDIIRAIETLSK